jgi:hypothetical protein
MPANPIIESEPTWVSLQDAAVFTGVSRATVTKACAEQQIPTRDDGRRRMVPLERVLVATTGKDLEALRRRLAKAVATTDAPPVVRDWAEGQLRILEPLIDRCLAAEQRAVLAEAKLELRQRSRSQNHQLNSA